MISLKNFYAEPPSSVCLLRLSALGDICNVLPVVRAIQECWPNTTLSWVIGKEAYPLVEMESGIDFIVLDKSQSVFDHRKRLVGQSFDILLNLHPTMRANLISYFIKAKIKLGFDRKRSKDFHHFFCTHQIPYTEKEHVVDGFLSFLKTLGFPVIAPRWDLLLVKNKSIINYLSREKLNVMISPCSGERLHNFRNWSVENYIDLIKALQDKHQAHIVLTGGNSATDQRYSELLEKSNLSITNLIGKITIHELTSIIAESDLVVCPDSGPTHIANALNTPVVTLFATSNKARTGPYRFLDHCADQYENNLKAYLNKSIDEVRWGARIRVADAMDSIVVSEVLEKIDILIREKS